MPKPQKTLAAEPGATVAKSLAALRAFIDGQEDWGVRELGAALEMPPSTVHRLLQRLRMEGFLRYDEINKRYEVGFEFARLSAAVMQRQGLRQAALPLMQELTGRTGESVWLALYDPDSHRISYVAESESPHTSRYVAPLGRVKGMVDSACGIAVLAGLPPEQRQAALRGLRVKSVTPDADAAIRSAQERRYAVLPATEASSAVMIASVVRDASGRPIGSLGIIVPVHRLGRGQEQMLGELVREAGDRLSMRMGAKLLGGGTTGSWQEAIGLITALLREGTPSLSITPALGGADRNLSSVEKGDAPYGLTVASSLFDARHGRGQFAFAHENLRTVMHLSELHLLVMVRADVEFRRLEDLLRLRVSPGEQGFASAHALKDALSVSGVDADRRRRRGGALIYLDYLEGKRQFEGGELDALVWMSSAANPMVRDLSLSTASRLHAFDAATLDGLLQLNPGYRRGVVEHSLVPRWLEADLVTLAVPTVLVCRADRSADEVQAMARTVYENRSKLAQHAAIYRGLDDSMVLNGLTAPLHPGAERYFAELGIQARHAAAAPGRRVADARATRPRSTRRQRTR